MESGKVVMNTKHKHFTPSVNYIKIEKLKQGKVNCRKLKTKWIQAGYTVQVLVEKVSAKLEKFHTTDTTHTKHNK